MNRKYLKESRINKKYSQKELSKKIGVTESIVSQWENGSKNPKVSTLIELCLLLDMDANILLNLKGEKNG